MSMPNLQSRLKRLEQRKANIRAMNCPACGAYLGKASDFEIVPNDTPPCSLCGQPYHVRLNLGRKLLDHDAESVKPLAHRIPTVTSL